ncbi:flavin oxidoreductase [Thalassotalea euphylliae]|uniref:Flavin oxidoreductase n=1 Tax=Thalassotalea euphylliae TaxID=1655234 RepID=A0A3E0TKR2_9GAMM|nr:flavin reductase [Thalassotalea euphylliae]REL25144.1 flavin oxidoreductase [Thalassotalea euphylliae]
MKTFERDELDNLEHRYRTRLINSLSGFKSANLIGSQDVDGQLNLAIVSSVVHLGANPPLIGLVMRPNSVPRHTFANITETGLFTINQVSAEFWQAAHQTSARYAQEQSEFDVVGLTPEFLNDFDAPFVAESQLKYGVKLIEVKPIEVNNTEFVIGEIMQIHVGESAVRADGYVDIESIETVAISGLDSYHVTNRLSRLSYAKPDKPVSSLTLDGQQAAPFENQFAVVQN